MTPCQLPNYEMRSFFS